MKPLYLLSISSGSCGNSYYLGTREWGVLVDAGIPFRQIKRGLKSAGLSEKNIVAGLLTHDHADHIQYAGNIEESLSIPFYATAETYKGMASRKEKINQLHKVQRIVSPEQTFGIRDFVVTPFSVPHDGLGAVGYRFTYDEGCVVFSGDLGSIPANVENHFLQAHYLVVESDYDEQMLQTGPYSSYLKGRIKGPRGHLSNTFISEWVATHYSPKLKGVFLSHISAINNTPQLALEQMCKKLEEKELIVGKDIEVHVLQRMKTSDLFELKV